MLMPLESGIRPLVPGRFAGKPITEGSRYSNF